MIFTFLYLFLSCFSFGCLDANPFAINFSPKTDLTNEDYINIQNQLKSIDLQPVLDKLYFPNRGYKDIGDFWGRATRGLRQTLINPEKGFYPEKHLEQIGKGGDMCIVTCVPYDGIYPALARSISKTLETTGFNGNFLYLIGGFPNPTGWEIQYAGVPYSFKIFMMVEAYKLGFNKVLWIDSAVFPLRDPSPLFNIINTKGALTFGWKTPADLKRFIFFETRETLIKETGVDVLNANYLCSIVFGLKMNTEKATKLVDEFYRLVELGTPFLSCFPEEYVLTALLGKRDYLDWKPQPNEKLLKRSSNKKEDVASNIEEARNAGYFFYHRDH